MCACTVFSAGGVGFQFLHGFRQRQLRGQGDQQMDVVGCATCGEDFDVKIFCNAQQVSPEPFLEFRRNCVTAVFCAENARDDIGGVSLRHGRRG
jgi:hypothetical protein